MEEKLDLKDSRRATTICKEVATSGFYVTEDYVKEIKKLIPGIWKKGNYHPLIYLFVCSAHKFLEPEEIQERVHAFLSKARTRDYAAFLNKGRIAYEQRLGQKKPAPVKKKRKRFKRNRMRAKSGRRPDLGNIFFRSALEANVARYFNLMNWSWEYEPEKLDFPQDYQKGPKRIIIDFKISTPSEVKYIEVKGKLWPGDKLRLKRLKKHFPDVFANFIIYTWSQSKDVLELAQELDMQVALVDDIDSSKIAEWE